MNDLRRCGQVVRRGGWRGWSSSRIGAGRSCWWRTVRDCDKVEARGGCTRARRGIGKADERRRDIGGRLRVFGIADQEAYARTIDSTRVCGRSLGEDDVGIARDREVSDDAEVERQAANADGRSALGLAGQFGDIDALRPKRLGDTDGPLAANVGSGGRILGENAASGNLGGVEVVLQGEMETLTASGLTGFEDGLTSELGNDCLASMNSEAHGDEGGDQGDCDQREGAEKEGKNALHRGTPSPRT
jgi:hypothetical protein